MMQILEENLEITPQAPWRWTEVICWISEAMLAFCVWYYLLLHILWTNFYFRKSFTGTSLAVQWLRLRTLLKVQSLVGQHVRSHMLHSVAKIQKNPFYSTVCMYFLYFLLCESESQSRSVVFNSLWPHIVHGILQARILEWVAFPFPRGSFQPKDQTQVSCIADRFSTVWATSDAYLHT